MRKLLLLLAILILPAAAFPVEVPPLASAASILVDAKGTVSVSGGQMKDLELNLSIPIANEYQQVQYDGQVLQDAEGNPYIRIAEAAPSNPFTYSKQVAMQTSERRTTSLPASYVIPSEYSQYYSSTARTQSGDPKIRELALRITENVTEPFDKVALLAIWVNTHLSYDVSLVGQENDASWTLFNRRGVCVEYSTLFAAFARSIGIPVKYVTGYAYSPKFESWLGHAWAEAYIGKWVPVDPTWLEVGSLDALHIEEAKVRELEKRYALTGFVSPPDAQLAWDAEGRSGAFAGNIKTQQIFYSEPGTNYELRAIEGELAPGGKTLVYFKMDGSGTVAGQERYAIIKPGKSTMIVWEVSASETLPRGYVYSCPLTLNSPVLETRAVQVQLDPRLGQRSDYSATLEKKNVQPGEENSVVLSLPGDRRGKDYFVLTPAGGSGGRIDAAADSIAFTSETAPGTD